MPAKWKPLIVGLTVGMVTGLGSGVFEGLVPSFDGSLGIGLLVIGTLGCIGTIPICAVAWTFTRFREDGGEVWRRGGLFALGALPGLHIGFRAGLGMLSR
jgi:hypothetical protein